MNDKELFTAGDDGLAPQGDAAREAVDSLRGYAYQVTAAALAWIDLDERAKLFLEVAEDYSVLAHNAFEAVQVKDTGASGTVTLNTESVRDAVSNYVSLRAANAKAEVQLRYFTTSEIGAERAVAERPGGIGGLAYWRKAAVGADVGPLRAILESDKFSAAVQKFVKDRDDEALRNDLLRKIHWDCGKPDLVALRKELGQRLVLIGRDTFGISAPETARIVDVLIYRVLERSIAKKPTDRVLTRSDFYTAVDHATRIFVPRAAADLLALISSGLTNSALKSLGAGLPVTVAEPFWLIEGNDLPLAKRMVPRTAVMTDVVNRMHRFGASIVFGASGLGKSSVARAVARMLGDEFLLIDFRNAGAEETRSRLDALIPRLGGIRAPILVFEDLNSFNDPVVEPSLALVFEAIRRRDRVGLVTCYLSPTAKSLSNAGLDTACPVECPYFTEAEAAELVTLHGGDPKLWGHLAYVAGAYGHPQLVHAFIAGIGARGWPRSEVGEILKQGLSSGDIEAEREAARRNLISVLPESARNLLYRLSMTIGHFNRAMALAMANTPPPIAQAGECMDALIGPWLETAGHDSYRVSPLAARSGKGMMTPAEQASIHGAIATQFMASGTVNGGDVDVIMMHAMLGKNEHVLSMLAHSILTSDERTLGLLAENFATFKLLRSDKPLYPDNLHISGLLRLAQFKILVAARETGKISDCVSALFSQSERQSDDGTHLGLRTISFLVVLGTMGIANFLENWVELLQQFQLMAEADTFLTSLKQNFEENNPAPSNLFGILFAVGSAGILSVARLEDVVDQVDRVEPARRSIYLSAIGGGSPDYSVFINGAWTSEQRRGAVNVSDAAARYRRMAIKTARWGIRPITVQCWVAQAVMCDEYANNSDGALKVLDEAVATLGEDILLSRARAKVYWRAQDHKRALPIMRQIADEIGRDNPIERAYALREAAISAAKIGEWAQAETWFLGSMRAATNAQLPDMQTMAVGLGADAAVAALQIEGVGRALRGLSEALTELAGIDPTSSLRAVYCHQVVRHTVLWAQSRIDRRKVRIDGETVEIEPGCCSNPEPPKAIAERLLGPIDLAWYMLAGSEVTSGENVGIADNLHSRLTGGPIPVMEVDLRGRRVKRDIATLDSGGFARHVWSHVEAIALLSQHQQSIMDTFNIFEPARGEIPPLPHTALSIPVISAIASDAVCAYAIAAACKQSAESLSGLETALRTGFGDDFPGASLLTRANATLQLPSASSFDEALIDAAMWFKSDAHLAPLAFCSAGIRFFQQISRSNFKSFLVPIVAAWQRGAWTRIVVSAPFSLSRPMQTVPAIKLALSIPDDDNQFLGTLFIATASATGVSLPLDMQTDFATMAANGKTD